nr:cell wall-binding repeat-containing protein [Tissierella sp.]
MKRFKGFIVFIIVFLIIGGNTSIAADNALVKRIKGDNRIETSIEISKQAFNSSNSAILVGYNGEVDALTGTILAQEKGAPILISSSNKLVEALKIELKRLQVEEVYILGGYSIVERQVEEELKALGLKVTRIKGDSREETAINIAGEAIKGKSERAFLTLGYGAYADALAIGPIAARENAPLLLTQKKAIKQNTLDYLDNSGVKKVTIVGGQNAVGLEVEELLKDRGISVDRIEGTSREETAINIARKFIKDPGKIFIANGYKYADAVSGGYLAARDNAPILLSHDKNLKDINLKYIKDENKDTFILGGDSSIRDSVYNSIRLALGLQADKAPDKPILPVEPVQPILPSLGTEEILIDNLTSLKKAMRVEMDAFNEKFTIEYIGQVSREEISTAIRYIFNDGSYIAGTISGTTYQVVPGDGTTLVNITAKYYNTLEQEAFIESEVDRILSQIVKPGMNEFQKVRAVHDYIIDTTEYRTDTTHTPHSAYTLFKEGKGVCQAYTLAAGRFLDKLDIENYYILGKADGQSHAWNLVKIDDEYYNLDVTKDDPVVKDGNDILSYKYFLISDAQISKTHKINRPGSFPSADDVRYEVLKGAYNPFEYKGELYFGNKDDEDKLYKVSLDSFISKKVSDKRAPYLVVNNGTIYFSNYSAGGYIYRSDLNGENLQAINGVHSAHLKLESAYITYTNMKTNKKEKIKL